MTQEEKLEEAKRLYETANADQMYVLECLFPELKESEDERIRKGLIKAFGTIGKKDWGGLIVRDILAWLEKQGKSSNKAGPKFKVGDFITNGYCLGKVIVITNDAYLLDTGQGIPFSCENTHLWSINDAKDGDVLYSLDSKQPFLYKEKPQFSQARGYCCINKFGEFAVWNTSKCVICADKYIPATKEQRDLLFSKMKEAGYEWDVDKKELKKELKKIESKKLNADEVIEWIDEHVPTKFEDMANYVEDFKQYFGL